MAACFEPGRAGKGAECVFCILCTYCICVRREKGTHGPINRPSNPIFLSLSRGGELENQSRTTRSEPCWPSRRPFRKKCKHGLQLGHWLSQAQTHRAGAGDAGTAYCVHIGMDAFWGACCVYPTLPSCHALRARALCDSGAPKDALIYSVFMYSAKYRT